MPSLHGRASRMSSLINSEQGGGNKKAGLFPSIGKDSWTNVAYTVSNLPYAVSGIAVA